MPSDLVAGIAGCRVHLALPWAPAARMAATIAGCCAFVVLVGLFGQFANRWLVVDVLDIGHALFLAAALAGGAVLGRRHPSAAGLVAAAGSGAAAGAGLALLVAAARLANLRWMLVSLTPATLNRVAYGLADLEAAGALAMAGAAAAALGAGLVLAPPVLRRVVVGALSGVVVAGLLRELIRSLLGGLFGADEWAFSYDGVLPAGAAWAAGIGAVVAVRPGAAQYAALPRVVRLAVMAALALFLLALPMLTNDFVAQVMMLVCLYTLMGLGLNIELGLAGLVDLGFVAFFAVGAYTIALLTSDSLAAPAHLGFFAALPVAVLIAAGAGFLFGLPVLRVRGDYLAIATLGLGEIIRVLVLSDMLKPALGGAQGIVNIPKPSLFGLVIGTPTRLFYMTAAMAALAGYCAWRLQPRSRTSWWGWTPSIRSRCGARCWRRRRIGGPCAPPWPAPTSCWPSWG